MYDNADDKIILKSMLSSKRYTHSLNTADTALMLASKYGVDEHKAYRAALLHDAAKDMSAQELIKRAEQAGITVDKYCRVRPHLLHAAVGAVVAKEVFGLCDEESLSAIAHHTMGKEDMTKLEKIIFLADLMEPARDYEGVDKVRMLAEKDLDEAILEAYDGIIRYVLVKGDMLHPDTVKARNYLILERIKKGNSIV